jgi:hypothetical protein
MSADRALKICLLFLAAIVLAVVVDILPIDEDILEVAEKHDAMSRNCTKPDDVMFSLKSLFFCASEEKTEN